MVNPRGNENAKRIGFQKSDFQIIEQLGQGAHGTVFKVRSIRNNKVYVMKQINFSVAKPGGELQAAYKREALREVQLLKRLEHNPHVVKYYNSFMEDECLHIIMEYAE